MTEEKICDVKGQRTKGWKRWAMTEWYVLRKDKPVGPYSDSQFHRLAEEGAIIPTDLVWYTGRKELIPAGEVHDLFPCMSFTAVSAESLPAWLVDYVSSGEPRSTSQVPSTRQPTYLRRHWRGDLPLTLTCWVNGAAFLRDDAKAVKWYRKAAEQGFAHAQHSLGVMYYEGRGVERNYALALKWYRKAGEQGNVTAQYDIGQMYQRGNGVRRNEAEAAKWYSKAALQGYDRAQLNLGLMHYEGTGLTQDYSEAYAWLSLAAAQENAEAKANREIAKKQMTSKQMAEAHVRAAGWKTASAQRSSHEDIMAARQIRRHFTRRSYLYQLEVTLRMG